MSKSLQRGPKNGGRTPWIPPPGSAHAYYTYHARIQGGFWVIGTPPPTAVCNFFLLVDLPRTLQQFGSAPEIPVRNPPSECTNPPPPSESWIRPCLPYVIILFGMFSREWSHLCLFHHQITVTTDLTRPPECSLKGPNYRP